MLSIIIIYHHNSSLGIIASATAVISTLSRGVPIQPKLRRQTAVPDVVARRGE